MKTLVAAALALLIAPPALAAKPLKVRSGALALTADNRFGLALVQAGLDAAPIAPASQDSLTFTMPAASGRVTARRATIRFAGGMDLNDAARQINLKLTDMIATVRGKRVTLAGTATLNGERLESFAFARGAAASVRRAKRRITIRRVALGMTDIGVTSLNSFFGTQYVVGAPMGSATITAKR